MCNLEKPCRDMDLNSPLEQIYDPCNEQNLIVEVILYGELPSLNGYT